MVPNGIQSVTTLEEFGTFIKFKMDHFFGGSQKVNHRAGNDKNKFTLCNCHIDYSLIIS